MSPDEQRLEHLALTAGPRVLTYLARRTSPPHAAADLYQQVLVTTWTRMARVPDGDEAALCWMLAAARRHLANHHRGERRRLSGTERLATSITVTLPAHGPEQDALTDALATLSPEDLELVRLTYWDDLTTEQAATVLAIRPAAARKRLQRARERIRTAFNRVSPAQEPDRATRGCAVTANEGASG